MKGSNNKRKSNCQPAWESKKKKSCALLARLFFPIAQMLPTACVFLGCVAHSKYNQKATQDEL